MASSIQTNVDEKQNSPNLETNDIPQQSSVSIAASAPQIKANEVQSNVLNLEQIGNPKNILEDAHLFQQKMKKKHRRGKPKPKNWKFQHGPKYNTGGGGGGSGGGGPNQRQRSRAKLIRSNSLAPYNTNKFLMEEHMFEVPLVTQANRTRDSSFSVDSEDNYFFSLPEDEEDFLTKEFSNVYEKARVERLESLSKQELIQECLQMEDRYSTDQNQINMQRITNEFMSRIRSLEQKIKELSRENYNLRCQVMRSTAAAASPPSATAPTSAACQPVPMESSSEDTESDSSNSSSSSSTSSSSDNNGRRRSRSCPPSSNSSVNENDVYIENNVMALAAEVDDSGIQRPQGPIENTLNDAPMEGSESSANSNSGFLSPKPDVVAKSPTPKTPNNDSNSIDLSVNQDMCD